MKRNVLLLILCCIIICGGILRFYGAEWGIPKSPYWRNFYQDEAFVLGILLKMEPDDLNPHYFINPTFHYYSILLSLKISTIFNYIKSFSLPVKRNALGQPIRDVSMTDYSKMYSVGRFVSIIEGIILIFLIFLIGRNLYNEKIGVIAAAFTAILPALIYQSHFLVVDAAAVFWLVLAFFFLTTKINPRRRKQWFIIAGILIGIAIGTKYTNILIILPFLYKTYITNKHEKGKSAKKILNKYTLITVGIALIVFFLTTPYSILSFNEFLNGDANGFGGIFGRRGLLYYNDYPTNFISPFTLATFHALRLPLTIFALLGSLYLLYKRTTNDILLLTFILPFYCLLIYHASPHLRHILPVLPFLMIATARLFYDFILKKKPRFLKPIVVAVIIFTFTFTLLFSLSLIRRMTPVDTRIECAEWVKDRITEETTIGMASFFPWSYTPPIDMITNKITLVGYNYENLLTTNPEYFIITEYEYRQFYNAHESDYMCKNFVKKLFQEEHYRIEKVFKKDFEILGVRFSPNFPNMDWNPVNPKIYIFKSKF